MSLNLFDDFEFLYHLKFGFHLKFLTTTKTFEQIMSFNQNSIVELLNNLSFVLFSQRKNVVEI